MRELKLQKNQLFDELFDDDNLGVLTFLIFHFPIF